MNGYLVNYNKNEILSALKPFEIIMPFLIMPLSPHPEGWEQSLDIDILAREKDTNV
jgi:hypothetical protein